MSGPIPSPDRLLAEPGGTIIARPGCRIVAECDRPEDAWEIERRWNAHNRIVASLRETAEELRLALHKMRGEDLERCSAIYAATRAVLGGVQP